MTTKIPFEELTNRRAKLYNFLPKSTVFIVTGNEIVHRNREVTYPFRQDSNFWYLTGIDQPDGTYLIHKNQEGEIEETLFIQDRDETKETWEGDRLSEDEAKEISGIKNIDYNKNLFPVLEEIIFNSENVYLDLNLKSRPILKQKILELTYENRKIKTIGSINNVLGKLRIIKSDWEILQIKKAIEITQKALKEAKVFAENRIKNGQDLYEFEIQAQIEKVYRENNVDWSFPPTIAAGKNACCLHYSKHNSKIEKDDLILIDTGCEVNYYAADLSRTFPASGEFTKEKQVIYNIVDEAKKKIIEMIKPGISLKKIQDFTVRFLTEKLIEIGIIQEDLETAIEKKLYFDYFMHSFGHWLGLDAHDLGEYSDENGGSKKLEPGMVVTVEPGLYFDPKNQKTPQKFRGIGIRLEDDILVTENGCEVL